MRRPELRVPQERPLLVGERNPYSDDPRLALYPYPARAAGARLPGILGLTPREYLRRFARANLSDFAPGQVRHLRPPLILLGAKVCRAFGVPFRPFTESGGVYVLPHPSGRCRIWNDPDSVVRARALLRRFL